MKRLFSLALALLMIGSLIFLPDMAVQAHAAGKMVTIPSPDDYFGKPKDVKTYSNRTIYYYTSYSYSKLPESKIDKYIDALEDCGLKLTKNSDVAYNGLITGKLYMLHLNDEQAINIEWYKTSKELRVQIFSCVKVGSTFDMTDDSDKNNSGIPNPGDYFTGLKAEYPLDSNGQISFDYSYSSYPQTAVDKYVKVLEALGLKAGKQNKFINGDYTRTVRYDSTVCVKFNYDASADILTVYLYPEDLKKSGFGIGQIDTRETEPTESIPTTPADEPTIPAEETVSVGEDKTIRIKKGQKLKLESKYTESAGAKVYTWSVTSGSNVISIESVGRNCDVTALKKGTAIIGLKYQYSYWGSDVLTGNTRRVNAQRTREYTIIVE